VHLNLLTRANGKKAAKPAGSEMAANRRLGDKFPAGVA
jgi:hypothetical protein